MKLNSPVSGRSIQRITLQNVVKYFSMRLLTYNEKELKQLQKVTIKLNHTAKNICHLARNVSQTQVSSLQSVLGMFIRNGHNGVFPKWSRTFSEFSKFRESDELLKHKLGSVKYLVCYLCFNDSISVGSRFETQSILFKDILSLNSIR